MFNRHSRIPRSLVTALLSCMLATSLVASSALARGGSSGSFGGGGRSSFSSSSSSSRSSSFGSFGSRSSESSYSASPSPRSALSSNLSQRAAQQRTLSAIDAEEASRSPSVDQPVSRSTTPAIPPSAIQSAPPVVVQQSGSGFTDSMMGSLAGNMIANSLRGRDAPREVRGAAPYAAAEAPDVSSGASGTDTGVQTALQAREDNHGPFSLTESAMDVLETVFGFVLFGIGILFIVGVMRAGK